jgi:stalled ribosome rescue protein Dom34
MSKSHVVVWADHQSAQILTLEADHVQEHKVRSHSHHTAQHGSAVRTQHEFFGALCDAIDADAEVLVSGSHTAIADLRHYVAKHRPALARRIVGYEVSDHPTDKQLAALARKVFLRHDKMSGGAPLE